MNGTMLQGFSWYLPADGMHWRRLAAQAKILAGLGVTAVWMPPAYKGHAGINDTGYGPYDLYDLGEFDQKGSVATKYGTKAEYLACIEALHARGVGVLGDVVFNHRMGADECERVVATEMARDDRKRPVREPREISAWTRFTFPGRGHAYSDFAWDWHCFDGVDHDAATGEDGIFLFEGKQWDAQVDGEFGNFDYLMGCDVDLDWPPVYDEYLRWGAWYVRTCGVDGLRLDALKHMDRDFYLRWLAELRAQTGRELFAVGEYWSGEVERLKGYLGAERAMSLFDAPLHFRLHDASVARGGYELPRLFERTLVAADPTRAVTFVENHDTQMGQALQSAVEPWFKPAAYALILLREAGYPCVFYGDLFGLPRGADCSGACVRPVAELPALMDLRRLHAFGRQRDYLADADVIGWTREGDGAAGAAGCAVIVSDRCSGELEMDVGGSHAGERWRCAVGFGDEGVTIGDDGRAVFRVHGGALAVYAPERAVAELGCDPHRFDCRL